MDPNALIREYGLLAVFAAVFLEQFGMPLPALPVLLIAGALSAADPLFGLAALILAVSASVIGGTALFAFGRRRGETVLRFLCRISFSPDKCVGYGRTAFDRIGPSALILARFMPGLSAMAPPLAGSTGMALPVFLTFQTLGALLFAMFGVGIGYAFDDTIGAIVIELKSYLVPAALFLIGCVVVWLGYVVVSRRNHRL